MTCSLWTVCVSRRSMTKVSWEASWMWRPLNTRCLVAATWPPLQKDPTLLCLRWGESAMTHSINSDLWMFLVSQNCVVLCTSQGDWVWLKKCPAGAVSGVNSDTEFVFVKVCKCVKEALSWFVFLTKAHRSLFEQLTLHFWEKTQNTDWPGWVITCRHVDRLQNAYWVH